MNYDKELAFAKNLAAEAGKIMREYFDTDKLQLEIKKDDTPLTIADTTINTLVIEEVKKNFSDCGVIGEEDSFETEREKLWIVDPIDGTMPFSLGIPVSTFCLAYVVDGEVMVGVVYDPFLDKLYSASRGGGAFVNDNKLSVTGVDTLDHSYLAAGGDVLLAANKNLASKNTRIFDLYSFAYCGALVSSGSFVAAAMDWGSPWDAAAISLIVEEAGGRATDLQGNTRRYNAWGHGIVLSNGHVHEELLKKFDYENSRN